MITIKDYQLRQSTKGKSFVTLEIQGDPEMVQSQETGRFYLTARRCSISSSFDEETAKTLIGKTMPGKIVRTQCDPYEYIIPDSGERIMLVHRYEYQPDHSHLENTKKVVFSEQH